MSIIQLKEANCKGCYKCIRNCDIKAIEFSNDQAKIRDGDCILCGKCTIICPQNAKQIVCDLPNVKALIKAGRTLYASLAPSFVSAFPGVTFPQMSAALKKLGFSVVEETAIGASKVSEEYADILTKDKPKNMITSCCPTSILLIEKYFPTLIPYLAPVVTPATAHARLMKQAYGDPDARVIFFGPCISKKHEAAEGDSIDYVLMFDELKEWLNESGISFGEDDPAANELHAVKSRLYPTPGGIIATIPEEARRDYKVITVDGLDRCISVLESLQSNSDISGYLIEMSACAGSCVQGPGMHLNSKLLTSTNHVIVSAEKEVKTPKPLSEGSEVTMRTTFSPAKVKDRIPDEATINAILASIGKTTPESMLNCGTCGYNTCREKAIAVFQGKADLKMCLPYMREKAESMSNLILENTPEAVFVTDGEFNLIEYNRTAEKMFSQLNSEFIGLPIDLVINSEEFENVKSSDENTYYAVCHDNVNNLCLEVSIIHAPNSDYIIIVRDITSEQAQKEELEKIRKETLETTQRVIDKQMRVAQEIASLLGETTGESKAALIKLKKSII